MTVMKKLKILDINFSFTSSFEYNECLRLSGTAVREIINDIIYKVGHPSTQSHAVTAEHQLLIYKLALVMKWVASVMALQMCRVFLNVQFAKQFTVL
jgi:hypothetical protein